MQAEHTILKKISGAACLFLLILSLTGTASAKSGSRTGFAFDTVVMIQIAEASDPEALLDQSFDLISSLEQLFSRTLEGSDIWNINHADGKAVTVSVETADLIRFSLSWCELTKGALDITIAPVSSLWDFTGETKAVPDEDSLKEALGHVDYRCVSVEENTVTLSDPDAMLDLGAVAKGYASDLIKELLEENGCESAIINLGGNIMTVGKKPDGSDWIIGVRRPFSDAEDSIEAVPAADLSVITSGSYERFFTVDGRLYHHILDPETGMSADTGLSGVSIVSSLGAVGDALSTACFVMGPEKGMELIESLPGIEALFITEDEELIPSSGWQGKPL